MGRRYRHERASRAWRAFAQGCRSLPTTTTTSITTTTTQVAPPAAGTVAGPSTATAPGPSTAPPAGQPTAIDTTWAHTSSAGTQTTPAAAIDPAAFAQMQRKLDRVLRKMSRLCQEVRQVNRQVRSIKRTLSEGQPVDNETDMIPSPPSSFLVLILYGFRGLSVMLV
ncbi:hypothetical protein NDU88_005877 [Pleurodeles waltl]|uniref:Uncharacterized protein n=1 Tax=Pleurodeles waltl TaxID=8319 RepID=A0AAV7RJY7_PLEWA|nr:hypothetical protein NDU88_005877 [Pleurodeles waltl]